MTQINKLVMHGFKSFADRTELLFGDRFNVVLGPNGSGKSNVIDALCFVLGKSSSKSMRAEKSANLIYNGGKTRTAAKQGEVSIFFDNKKKTFPIDSEEVKISRIVRANGQSVYKINNKTRTRQEVVDLLSVAKINPDGYNIILQGDIVQFIEMSPVERRMIIEEIAGISIYEEKKQKALRELERVDEKLKEAEIILAEREKQLKELKKDRDEAMKYKGLNDRIVRNKASSTALQIKKKRAEKEEQDKIMADSKAKIDELNVKITELKKKIDDKKAEITRITEEIEKKGEEEQLKLNKEVEQLKVDIATREQRIENHKAETKKIDERKKQLGESLKEVEAKLEGLVSEKKDVENDLAEKKKDLKLVEKKIDEFKKKHSMENLGEIEKQIERLDKESEAKQADVGKLREEQQNLFREKDKLELQIQNLNEKIEKVGQIERENKDQINKLKRKKEEFKKATLELNKLLNEDSSLAAQLNNAKIKLVKSEEDLSKLRVKNASVRESLAGSEAVKKILDERTKFGGEVFGLISEIGQVESKYAIALETAAGPKLKSIVVEDDATAARCIKYLKEKRLGVASFLPLNKIKGVKKDPEIEKYCRHKGALGFAMDFIEHDPKFKNVFSFVFGNTLVVENIDVAREIGIGNAKMVTLDGDMAETSGAMHGGYRQKKEKGLSFQEKDLVNEMKELEQKTAEYSSVISKVEAKRVKNEEDIKKLREFKAGMDGDIITLERTLHLESGDVDVSKKQKDLINENIRKVEKQNDVLQEKISELTGELAKMKIKRSQLRSQSDGIRSPTVLAEMNAFEQKKSELREKIGRVEEICKQIKEKIDNIFGPEKEKTSSLIASITKEAENFKKDITRMKKDNEQAAADLKDKEKKAKKFYEQFKKLFETKDEINGEISRLDKSVFLREDERRKNEMIINNTQLVFSELTGQLQALEEEFKKYEGVELEDKSEEALKREFNNLERMMENMGNVNMRALEVYDTVEKEYNSLTEKKNKLKTEKEDVFVMMNEIETKKKDLFMKHFEKVNETFKKFFSELSTKGDASLELENPQDPFQEGVMIKVRITGNKFMDIRSLSGGEKTMTALAFIFAIQEYDPASFYIMDEVDAALDKTNSIKLAHMIKKYAAKAQYVVISHNDYLLSEADILYGVTMNEHAVSKVVSLKV